MKKLGRHVDGSATKDVNGTLENRHDSAAGDEDGFLFPIQRILLIHFGLLEIGTGESVLDEAASLEELALPILYWNEFGRQEQQHGSQSYPENNQLPSSSIIQLANLASAFYTLPLNLSSTSSQKTRKRLRAKTVDLDSAILLFQPVEQEAMDAGKPGLVLVMQLAKKRPIRRDEPNEHDRQKMHDGQSQTQPQRRRVVTTTPQAVATAFANHHRLFCLLRGGGVHTRLCKRRDDGLPTRDRAPETMTNSSCLYPGMDQFYLLLKQKRKLDDRLKRQQHQHDNSSAADRDAMLQQSRDLSDVIQSFARHNLPLESLRADLRFHYHNFLMEMQHLAILGSGRCLVEWIPRPLAQSDGHCAHASSSPTDELQNQIESMQLSMQQFLRDSRHASGVSILAAACFLQKDNSHLWTVSESKDAQHPSQHDLSLLLSHMTRVHERSTILPGQTSQSTPWTRLWPFLANTSDAVPSPSTHHSENTGSCGFIPPPPLSSLSAAAEHVQHIDFREPESRHEGVPLTQHVWAPRIHGLGGLSSSSSTCRSCLYEWHGVLRFLFFLSDDCEDEKEASPSDGNVLLSSLNEFLLAHGRLGTGFNAKGLSLEEERWVEKGQQIIFVDRETNKVILYSSSKTTAKASSQTSHHGASDRKIDSNSKPGVSTPSASWNNTAEGGTGSSSIRLQTLRMHVDARHELASRLGSFDTLLAVEDAMTQFETQRQGRLPREKNGAGGFHNTLCTLLSKDWVWATHNKRQELYVVLDASLYVTIADVEQAVAKVQGEFLK